MKSRKIFSLVLFLTAIISFGQTWQNPSSNQSYLLFNVDGGDPSIEYDVGTGFTINAKYQEYINFTDGGTTASNLFVDGNSNRIGIGTSSPGAKLHVYGSNVGSGNVLSSLMLGKLRGPEIQAIQESIDDDRQGLAFRVKSSGAFSDSNFEAMRISRNGNVGIGTTSPDSKLTVKGNIHAEEVKVDLSVPGPDYVFKEDYDLKPLEEVQNYIKQNGHLPNIPSAKEMEENGVQLGQMNMRLLEKIEELTLYTLEQERKLKKLESLKQEVGELKKIVQTFLNK